MDKKSLNAYIGSRIKLIREVLSISQSELARNCLIDRQYIHKLEKGLLNHSAYTLLLICTELSINIEDIFPRIKFI